jgi:hypothetical protein
MVLCDWLVSNVERVPVHSCRQATMGATPTRNVGQARIGGIVEGRLYSLGAARAVKYSQCCALVCARK